MFLRYGYISDYDPATGRVRVELDDETDVPENSDDEKNVVTQWIPFLVKGALTDKETFPFDITAHVACMMDEFDEDGVCLGAIYDAKNKPDGGGKDIHRIKYKDGSVVEFNRSTGNYTFDIKGGMTIKSGGTTVFDAGANEGLVKVVPLTSVIVAMQNEINKLKTILASWSPVPQDGGAALKALLVSWVSTMLTVLQKSQIENTDVKH